MVGVIDASFLRKSGKATEGLGKFWNSSSKKAEKGLEPEFDVRTAVNGCNYFIHSWKRRKATQLLINGIFEMLEIDTNNDKIRNIRNKLEKFGAIAA